MDVAAVNAMGGSSGWMKLREISYTTIKSFFASRERERRGGLEIVDLQHRDVATPY